MRTVLPVRWRLPAAAAVLLALAGAAGCGGSDEGSPAAGSSPSDTVEEQGGDLSPSGPYTGLPRSIAAVGHSAITGEGTPAGKASSWATGTDPAVRSVYQRILEQDPAVEGHVVNLGQPSADVGLLSAQAQQLLAQEPQPQLVLIATLDGDIACPTSRAQTDAYGQALGEVLADLSAGMPGSRFFITAQISTPGRDAEIYTRSQRATVGGTGPCAFLDPRGEVVPAELDRLESAIAAYREQVVAACARTDRCRTDQSGTGWTMQAEYYSSDLNHLDVRGQAAWAAHVWHQLEQARLVPAS